MKKFNVKNNMSVVLSEGFKNSIKSAVNFTYHEHNSYGSSRFDRSFVGTVVTFNPNNQEIEYFGVREFADMYDSRQVSKLLHDKFYKVAQQDEYKDNELVEIIYARDFEYHGHVGYVETAEREQRNMKLDNMFMSMYINIISRSNDESIEDAGFSIRTTNCLLRAGYETIGEVKALSFDEISRVRNLGRNSIEELETKLNIKFV